MDNNYTISGGVICGNPLAPMKGNETIIRTSDFVDILNAALDKTKKEIGNKNMENLYNVVLVDGHRDILLDEKVVAKNEESAKFNAGVYSVVTNSGLSLDDVTVIVRNLGSVKVVQDN